MAVSPVRALYDVFLARFFENESTLGRSDLRESFFWLIGMLAAPGMFWAFWQHFRWSIIAMIHGAEALRVAALFDKALYLTLTYVAIGFLACGAWPSLVIDRRDGLILGALPVRLRTIVVTKLGAVFAYIGLIMLGMHSGAALLFGTFLADGDLVATARATLGHVLAASALGLFVFLGMAALAALTLALIGPRRFLRVSSALQLACVGLVTAGLVLLPAISGAAMSTLTDSGGARAPWILYTPPLWFLGLYETVAGTTEPIMQDLAGVAVASFGGVLAVLLAAYPIATRRVLASGSPAAVATTRPWSRGLADLLVRLLARRSPTRGALQFTAATFGRIQRHRTTLAIAFGISLTIGVPIVIAWLSPTLDSPRRSFDVPLLATGCTLMFCMAAGVRVALALPSELNARWLFAAVPSPAVPGRVAARRLMWAIAVVPGALLSGVMAWVLWDPGAALLVLTIVAIAGFTLTDVHLWGFVGVPCARLLAPGSANLQARWPKYLAGLYVVCVVLPQLLVATHAGAGLGWMIVSLAPLTLVIRRGSDRAARVNAASDEDENQLLLLDLSVQTRSGKVPSA